MIIEGHLKVNIGDIIDVFEKEDIHLDDVPTKCKVIRIVTEQEYLDNMLNNMPLTENEKKLYVTENDPNSFFYEVEVIPQ